MSRLLRIKSDTYIYHIMIRGVNKIEIFYDIEDRKKFLQILTYYKDKYFEEIFAYCLMNNHVHLLIKAKENLDKFMQCIQTVYALYFNKKYKRVGHLFQDRFKSIPVEDSKYLLECVRYIHQNPVKACISEIDKYKWSSYNEYITTPKIISSKYILDKFQNNKEDIFIAYRTFMNICDRDSELRNMIIEDKLTDEEAVKFINENYNMFINKILEYDVERRNKILKQIISSNIFSIRQLERITKINRNEIRNINSKRV